jgi:plasmid maintenance system antidote protein VapI
VLRMRVERIAREEKPVTADIALLLRKFFKTGAASGCILMRAISKRPKTCSRRRST